MSLGTPSADPTVHIPTYWDNPTIIWRNQDSSVVGVYGTNRGLSITGSLSSTLSAERFYTRFLPPVVDDELVSKWYVDSLTASLSGGSFTASFVAGDWTPASTYYYIIFNHSLSSETLIVEVYDTTFPEPTQVMVEDLRLNDPNNLELRIGESPDERFDGYVVISGEEVRVEDLHLMDNQDIVAILDIPEQVGHQEEHLDIAEHRVCLDIAEHREQRDLLVRLVRPE
jgi:hypothetical protein